MNYAPRITLSYADLSGVLLAWSDKCAQMVVYEHEADIQVSQTHVHVLMLVCTIKAEQFKRMLYDMLPYETRKGNALWSWSHKDNHNVDKKFITYMSNGRLQPKFVKNYPMEEIEELRMQWIDPPVKGAAETAKVYDEYAEICKAGIEHFYDKPHFNLDEVRSWTIAWYWRRDGRLPHIGTYKRNACSLFLKLYEVHTITRTLSCGIDEIKNLWY